MDIFNKQIKKYQKKMEFSYTFGAFPTYELINSTYGEAVRIISHRSYRDYENMARLCGEKNIPIEINDKLIEGVRDKNNTYVMGVFKKYHQGLDYNKAHIVLVNPSNMGNLGTIIRTAVGFGIYDLALIGNSADIFNPKTIRASMGSIFYMRFEFYEDFSQYQDQVVNHDLFPFMLNEDKSIKLKDRPETDKFSLIFGNEATGLDPSYAGIGQTIYIPQTPYVDSLNLPMAAGIAMYEFMKDQ